MMASLLLALAAAVAVQAPPPDWGTARDVEVRLSGFTFQPPRIELSPGQAIRLELVNDLTASRSFHAPRFFAAAEVPETDRTKLHRGTIRLRPGERTTIRLMVPAAGHYAFRSGRVLQAALGLRGVIVVE